MLKDRRCDVCRAAADLTKTSASFGRVHYFCAAHGASFNALAFAWAQGSTHEVFARIDLWLEMKREQATASAASPC